MSKDIVAAGLNQMMNALKARKKEVKLEAHSKVLTGILAIAKMKGYVKNFKADGNTMTIELDKIHFCKAIKPRYSVGAKDFDKYSKRYLPAYNIGIVIVSTNKGIMTHQTAKEKNLGGSLLAYIY